VVVEVHDGFTELFNEVLGDTGLTSTRRAVEKRRVSSSSVRDRFKNAGEVIDFSVAVLYLPRDEFWLENPASAIMSLCRQDVRA